MLHVWYHATVGLTEKRPCPYCHSCQTTMIHHLYRCPIADFVWNIFRSLISYNCGFCVYPDKSLVLLTLIPQKLRRGVSKNIRTFIMIAASAARQTLFTLLYRRKTNISSQETINIFCEEMATVTKYHRIISIDNVSKRANNMKYMLTAAVRSFNYLRETGISTPLHKFLKHDTDFSRTERE